MVSEKEKLQEELKLLEESLSLEVITKEEYDITKARIEAKIKELDQTVEEKPKVEEIKEEPKVEEEKKEEPIVRYEDLKKEEEKKIEIKEVELKEEVKDEIAKEEVPKEEEQVKKQEEEQKVEEAEIKKEELTKEPEEEHKGKEKPFEEVKVAEKVEGSPEQEETEIEINKKMIAIILGILLIGFVSGYYFFSNSPDVEEVSADVSPTEIVNLIACSSDDECKKQGSIGTCLNEGTEGSECQYVEDVKVKLLVLNSNDCFNCNSGRVLSILKGFYPNLDIQDIDIETNGGKEIARNLDINALPAYILNSSFKETYNYDKFSSSFNEIDGNFIMKNTAANSNYYLEREEIPNRLDLFLKSGQFASLQAEENLELFWQAFSGIVILEKHDSDSEIVKELGINTFPTFLVNNKIKFSGVQAANIIKENFCQVNKLDECELELTKSLV